MSDKSTNLIWIDLEMTGLDPEKDVIIEIATVVTDLHLNEVAQGPVFAIHQPKSVMDSMDEWNTSHHGKSGLTQRVLDSDVDMHQAEQETLTFLSQHVAPQASPMCGNTICQDRRFMYRYMPKLVHFFHYRNLDVSSIKELVKRWAPDLSAGLSKKGAHLALDDIRDSIKELKYYREHFLKLP